MVATTAAPPSIVRGFPVRPPQLPNASATLLLLTAFFSRRGDAARSSILLIRSLREGRAAAGRAFDATLYSRRKGWSGYTPWW